MCQFGVKWRKNSGYHYWIFTPNKVDVSCLLPDVYEKFHQNRLKIATVRARTDIHSQTDRQINTAELSPLFTTFTWQR